MGETEIDKINIGDYVLASRWGCRGWNDPWAIGFVQTKVGGYITLGKKDGSLIDSVNCYRKWPHAIVITDDQAAQIIPLYTVSETISFEPNALARILGTPLLLVLKASDYGVQYVGQPLKQLADSIESVTGWPPVLWQNTGTSTIRIDYVPFPDPIKIGYWFVLRDSLILAIVSDEDFQKTWTID